MKIKAKIITDVMLTLALLFCIGYQFWGQALHEWIGAGMYLLFFIHQALNLGWYKTLLKWRYRAFRMVQCVLNLCTLAAMLALIYSGIVMSRYVFASLPVHNGLALARRLHILGSYWGFLLMSLHLGMHWNMVIGRLFLKKKAWVTTAAFRFGSAFVGALIALRGAWALISRGWGDYLFLRSEFVFLDYSEPPLQFYMDYLCLMGLCIYIAHYGAKLLGAAKQGKPEAAV